MSPVRLLEYGNRSTPRKPDAAPWPVSSTEVRLRYLCELCRAILNHLFAVCVRMIGVSELAPVHPANKSMAIQSAISFSKLRSSPPSIPMLPLKEELSSKSKHSRCCETGGKDVYEAAQGIHMSGLK